RHRLRVSGPDSAVCLPHLVSGVHDAPGGAGANASRDPRVTGVWTDGPWARQGGSARIAGAGPVGPYAGWPIGPSPPSPWPNRSSTPTWAESSAAPPSPGSAEVTAVKSAGRSLASRG